MAVCIFDPASKVLGLKELLFFGGWVLFIFYIIVNGRTVYMPMRMIIYLLLFIFVIPLISINYYFLINGDIINYDGYSYFKPYLFLTIVLILSSTKIDLIKPTIIMISLLSILTIIIFIIIIFNESFVQFLYLAIIDRFGILDIGERTYGGFVFSEIHFHASPLIIFPIGYFSLAVLDSRGLKRILFGLFLVINMFGMFLGGTRNNVLASTITPILIAFWYSKRKIITSLILIAVLLISIGTYQGIIKDMFDTEESSNSTRLSFQEDYFNLFADSKVLFFGQGLGSSFNTTVRGYVSLTELTYYEFIRRFGLILSSACFLLLLYPLGKLRLKQYRNEHYIFICYALYLMGCFFQPLLMSSTGMLLMSLILYKTFTPPLDSHRHVLTLD